MKKLLILMLAVLFMNTAIAQQTETITVDGYGENEPKALTNAFVSAVEQSVGVLIKSKVLIENGALIEEQVLSLSTGFIESYKLISSIKENSLHKVTITAVVKKSTLQAKIIEVFQAETELDTKDIFAQAYTKSRQIEQSTTIIKDFFPELATKFANALVMDIVKIIIDTDNVTDGKVPYKIIARYYVEPKLYNDASEELHDYLIKIDAKHSVIKYNNDFWKTNSKAIYRIDGDFVIHKYIVNDTILNTFRDYFLLELERLNFNKRWQIVITEKSNKTRTIKPNFNGYYNPNNLNSEYDYNDEVKQLFIMSGVSSDLISIWISNSYMSEEDKDVAYFVLPLAVSPCTFDEYYRLLWRDLAKIFNNDESLGITLYHEGYLSLDELDSMKKIAITKI